MTTHTPESLPPTLRKCPIHKCWIQMHKVKEVKTRYCPVCHAQKMKEQAQVFEEAGTLPPNVRIGKI